MPPTAPTPSTGGHHPVHHSYPPIGRHRTPGTGHGGIFRLPTGVLIRVPAIRPIPAKTAPVVHQVRGGFTHRTAIGGARPAAGPSQAVAQAQQPSQITAQLKVQLRASRKAQSVATEHARDKAIAQALAKALAPAPAKAARHSAANAGQQVAAQQGGGRHRAGGALSAHTREPDRYYGKHTEQSQGGKHHRKVAPAAQAS
jgi:hypothetical protein